MEALIYYVVIISKSLTAFMHTIVAMVLYATSIFVFESYCVFWTLLDTRVAMVLCTTSIRVIQTYCVFWTLLLC